MSTTMKLHSNAIIIRVIVLLLVPTALRGGFAYGQAPQNQPAGIDDDKDVADALNKASRDDSESIHYVEKVARARAVQAVPMLEEKFVHTQDELDKAHIASALEIRSITFNRLPC